MKPTSLTRRLVAGAVGLAIGALGMVAFASPAQAQTNDADDPIDCGTFEFTVDPPGVRAWRAVIDDQVVWTSGDFDNGDDLGNDHQALVDKGWTRDEPFDVVVDGDDALQGTVTMQWWHVEPPDNPNGWTDWPGGEWNQHNWCSHLEPPEVTQPTCDADGYITIPEHNPDWRTYTIDGTEVEAGDHAYPAGEYTVYVTKRDDAERTWTVELVVPADCNGGDLPEELGSWTFDCDVLTIELTNPFDETIEFTFAPSDGDDQVVEVEGGETATVDFPSAEGLSVDVLLDGESIVAPEDQIEITSELWTELGCDGQGGELAETGTPTGMMALGATVLLAVGGGLFLIARRRRIRFTA